MEKIKVGLITSVIDGRKGRGTALVARKFLEQIPRFTDSCDFTLIHGKRDDDPFYTHYPEIIMPRSPLPFATQLLSEILFWLRYRLTMKKFDIVHYLHPRIWPSYLLASGKKIVISIYDAGVMLDLHPHGFADRLFQFTNRFLHQRMHLIITSSEFGKEEIVEHYKVRPECVSVVPLGVDPQFKPIEITQGDVKKLEARYGIRQPYILSVSRFDPHKNILRLIDAFALFKKRGHEARLVLVGGRHMKDYSALVDNKIADLGLTESIVITPFISDEDMPLLYSAAQAFVFPSLHEGFGLPIVEAMACGIPVATSSTTACGETARNAARLFNPENVNDIAQGMEDVFANEALRKELREKGLTRAREFTWAQMADRIFDVYAAAGERRTTS